MVGGVVIYMREGSEWERRKLRDKCEERKKHDALALKLIWNQVVHV